ncbi:MAG: transposase [Anaerolineaceae bacterium]|nr:transposase [Anaerolineaceae bacterium]
MMNQENNHGYQRKSMRLREYDYSQPGAYFVTIVTQSRICLFGKIENGEMILNDAGEMVKRVCFEVEKHLYQVDLGEFQVMPNHLHIIVKLGLSDWVEGQPQKEGLIRPNYQISLIDVISRIKSITTYRYIQGVRNNQWLSFPERLWQRGFYDHVIRDEQDYERIKDYIASNPLNWANDEEFFVD